MEEQKINVCRALASIFGEDASDEEIAFVGRAALDLGLDESALKIVLQAIGAEMDTTAVLESITDINLRRFLFRRVVAATLLDDQLTDEEKAAVDKVIEVFGFDKDLANQYCNNMKELIALERKGEEIVMKLG
jgi:hypothetical protein